MSDSHTQFLFLFLSQIYNSLKYEDVVAINMNHVIPGIVKVDELSSGVHEFETQAGSVLQFKVWKPKRDAEGQKPVTAQVSVKGFPNTVVTIKDSDVVETINGPVYT